MPMDPVTDFMTRWTSTGDQRGGSASVRQQSQMADAEAIEEAVRGKSRPSTKDQSRVPADHLYAFGKPITE
jgi:hypothetical protein